MYILYYIKFKSSLEYKTIFDYTILYLVTLIITNFEFLEDPQTEQINL